MSPDFEYFNWGCPTDTQPAFALCDTLDNHFMIMSTHYENLYHVATLIRSKTLLNIVDVSTAAVTNILDNSVIENWGIRNRENWTFDSIRVKNRAYSDSQLYYNFLVIKDPILVETFVQFDNFKKDLQKQIFFFYHCIALWTTYKQNFISDKTVYNHIKLVAELSESFEEAIDMIATIPTNDETESQDLLDFLKLIGLYYE